MVRAMWFISLACNFAVTYALGTLTDQIVWVSLGVLAVAVINYIEGIAVGREGK